MANIINFNDDDKNKQSGQESGNQLQSGGESSTITPVSAFNAQQSVPQAESQNQSASSGQFTNIQKYLQANKGAGQQVASGVNKQMDKSLQPGKIQQEDAAKAFQASVQNANDVLGRGQQYGQQLQAPVKQTQGIIGTQTAPSAQGVQPVSAQQVPQTQSFDPNAIVGDQQKLVDFTKIRTGQGVDEEALKNKASTAQTLAGVNQMSAQNLLGQTKSASGRAGLVSQAFNKPSYTQGQQRLDTLFLTGAGKQGINAVQNQAKQNVNQAGEVYNQAAAGVNQAGAIGTQEQALQQDLQRKADTLESGYMSNLQSLIPQVNQLRQAERDRWQTNFDVLTGKKVGAMDADIFNEYQLQNGERSFNVLNDPNLTLRQIANISDRNAVNTQDVATQADVDYYKQLAQLAKGNVDANGNFVGPANDQLQLRNASDMERAAAAITGDGSLRNKLDTANNQFIQDALKDIISGHGEDKGTDSWLGRGATAEYNMSANVRDILNNLAPGSLTQSKEPPSTMDMARDLSLSDQYNRRVMSQLPLLGGLLADSSPSALAAMVGNSLSGIAGTSSGSMSAAKSRAMDDYFANLKNYFAGKGYDNYVTTNGVKNNTDITNQQIDTARALDKFNQTNGIILNSGTKDVAKYLAGMSNLGAYMNPDSMNDYGRANQRYDQLAKEIESYRNAGVKDDDTTQANRIQQLAQAQNQISDILRTQYEPQAQQLQAQTRAQQQAMLDQQKELKNQFYARLGMTPPPENTTGHFVEGEPMTIDQVRQRFAGK